MTKAVVVAEQVQQAIRRCRGQRVVLDADLAGLYGVDVRTLKQAVKRNLARSSRGATRTSSRSSGRSRRWWRRRRRPAAAWASPSSRPGRRILSDHNL
jgi:hypothetical protein